MLEFKIVPPPPAFVIAGRKGDEVAVTATEKAAAWLAEQCAGGFQALALLAIGNDTRLTLSGAAEGAAIVLRRENAQ